MSDTPTPITMPAPAVLDTEKGDLSDQESEKIIAAPEPEPESHALPDKTKGKLHRMLQYTIFTTYRKIFAVTFTLNMIAFIAFVAKTRGAPDPRDVANAVSANIMVAIIFRQENFVNLVYDIFIHAPLWFPLWIRKDFAKVYHYGGAHSGNGVAAVVWFLLYTGVVTRQYVLNPTTPGRSDVITAYILLACFLFILATAHPAFRAKAHDHYEAIHRFAGWTVVIVYWVSLMLGADSRRRKENIPLGLYIAKDPAFWFLCVTTFCIILSWLRLRKRDVYPEILSDHAIRLHFKERIIKPFGGIRVSTNPLFEWHVFASTPDEDENGKVIGYSFVVSNAGDWTNSIIKNPPSKMWIRSDPLYGLHIVARLFKRYVIIATGSGIGPFLSLIYADFQPTRIFWSTQNPEVTYGKTILNTVLKCDPKAVIWNTRERGRPDMIQVTYDLVKESNAEAALIISNPKLTRQVVYGMESRGIACYGAIFDS